MKRILAGFAFLAALSPAWAWNAAGHRLVAAIAWRQLAPESRLAVVELLRRHPDYSRWTARADGDPGYTAFLEASTWPDDIRQDPRFFDEDNGSPTTPFPGMADTSRHRSWHYVDYLATGQVLGGELDRQLDKLIRQLRRPGTPLSERAYALPWLVHLVGDAHQPLHAGSRDDAGGNRFEVENPFNPRQPVTRLHTWWDDLPGPPWLRGARLEQKADRLLVDYGRPPKQGNASLWVAESHDLGERFAYPPGSGSRLPVITEEFRVQSEALAQRRLAEAGYRLGRLLDGLLRRVPRETD